MQRKLNGGHIVMIVLLLVIMVLGLAIIAACVYVRSRRAVNEGGGIPMAIPMQVTQHMLSVHRLKV